MIGRAQLPAHGTLTTAMPLFHTAGCAMSVLGCAHRRARLALCLFDPALVLAAAEQTGADAVFGVPTMLVAMLSDPAFDTTDLTACSVVLSGGSSVPPELVRRVEQRFAARFSTVFGQTELSPIVTQTSPDDAAADKADTVGRPLPQVELKISDPVTGEVAEIGAQGEVCARGYQAMLGYFDMPGRTADTIDSEGWLHTRDLGTLDQRGYLRITGRLKDMIIRGGENIYPAEIEQVLFTHPAVREVAVLGVADQVWGETVAAVIVPTDPASPPDAALLHAYCRASIAPHKLVPRRRAPAHRLGQSAEVPPPRTDRRASAVPPRRDPNRLRLALRSALRMLDPGDRHFGADGDLRRGHSTSQPP